MTRTGNLPAETIFVDTFNDDGFANVGDFISPQTDGKTITFAAGQTQAQFAITILDGHSHPTDPTFSLLIQRNPGDNDLTFLAKTLFTIPEGAAPNPMEVVQIPEIYPVIMQRPVLQPEVNFWIVQNITIDVIVGEIVLLPETVLNVFPVIQIINLALGHNPSAAQLSGWVPFIESHGLLGALSQTNVLLDQMAEAFVASTNFANVYNNGVLVNPNSVVTAHEMQVIIQLATGVASTTTQVGAWLALGLTVDQVFVEFALGDQYTAFSKSAIQQYLTTAADAAIGSTGHGAVQVTGISADVNHGAAVHA